MSIRDETIFNISIYCNIYYSNTIQYGLKEISIYCTLQYIVIYCIVMGDIDILWSRLLPNPLSRLLHLSRYINNSLNDFKTIKSTLIVH